MNRFFFISSLLLASAPLWAQGGLDPSDILKPLGDEWPTYAGDYTAKRYSSLKRIDPSNVKQLSLAWVTRFTAGSGPNGGGQAANYILEVLSRKYLSGWKDRDGLPFNTPAGAIYRVAGN